MGVKPPSDARKFPGIVGKQSKVKSGKQGVHHHPLMSKLGDGVTGGMKPGGFTGFAPDHEKESKP